jgi:hypothetical protein
LRPQASQAAGIPLQFRPWPKAPSHDRPRPRFPTSAHDPRPEPKRYPRAPPPNPAPVGQAPGYAARQKPPQQAEAPRQMAQAAPWQQRIRRD